MELVLQIGGQHIRWRSHGNATTHGDHAGSVTGMRGFLNPCDLQQPPLGEPAVVLQVNGTGVADFYLQHLMETPWRPQGGPKVKVMADHRWSLANCNS